MVQFFTSFCAQMYLTIILASTDEHFYFYSLAVVNNVAVHICVPSLSRGNIFISTSTIGVKLLGHRVITFLIFWGNGRVSKTAAPFHSPTGSVSAFQFLLCACYCLSFCVIVILMGATTNQIVVLKFLKWSPQPPCDSCRRGSLWEVVGVRGVMRFGPCCGMVMLWMCAPRFYVLEAWSSVWWCWEVVNPLRGGTQSKIRDATLRRNWFSSHEIQV